ncbi:MAG TPA: BACON domain-containing carbohydrate-binding protein, partial [Verrucomicrobiae bacterium]|nr:BACON domain-containing carbohydrate-binding protein [Verrucomicrobiae bacterium]
NPGAARTGTLTIASNTVTVTQANAGYSAVTTPVVVVTNGLDSPGGVAVGTNGDIYIANTGNNVIDRWSAVSGTLSSLPIDGMNSPAGLALDSVGNLYIANTGVGAVDKWTPTNNHVSVLVSGLSNPVSISLDSTGNVYFADSVDNVVGRWANIGGTVSNLAVFPTINGPSGISVDIFGNVFIADRNNDSTKKWSASNGQVITLDGSGLNPTWAVAADGHGNLFMADYVNSELKEIPAFSSGVITVVPSGISFPTALAVDATGNIYIAETGNNAIKKLSRAFINPASRPEGLDAGSDSLPAVVPASANLQGLLAPTSDQPWLTITGVTNGVVSFSFTSTAIQRTANISLLGNNIPVTQFPPSLTPSLLFENPGIGSDSTLLTIYPATTPWTATANDSWLHVNLSGNGSSNIVFTFDPNLGPQRTGTVSVAGLTLSVVQQGPTNFLASPAVLEGSSSATDSVTLVVNPPAASWTAAANANWLHVAPGFSSGVGSTNFVFSYDANPGISRTGTVTVAGQTLTVWQVPSNYVPSSLGPTKLPMPGLNYQGVAVDNAGKVYAAAPFSHPVVVWNPVTGITTSLNLPNGANDVAVDAAGNVYACYNDNTVRKRSAIDGQVTNLPISGLNSPGSLALDRSGNLYIADFNNNAVKKWNPANGILTTLSFGSLNQPSGVAVDAAGNVYVADFQNHAVKELNVTSGAVTTIPFNNLRSPDGVAVDNAGNVYETDFDPASDNVQKWSPATGTSVPIGSGTELDDVAVDPAGHVYLADFGSIAIKEIPHAFVAPQSFLIKDDIGTATLPPVIPANADLNDPFVPGSDQPWLTVAGITNGTITVAVGPMVGTRREGNLYVFGQPFPITEYRANIGTTDFVEGPAAGTEGLLINLLQNVAWSATANAPWLHWRDADEGAIGSTNISFSFDANPGPTRVGTLTLDNETITVTQAGSTYVAAPGPVTILPTTDLSEPFGVAVDPSGRVYVSSYDNAIMERWDPATGIADILPIPGLSNPVGIALDPSGNLCIADFGNSAIKSWTPGTSSTTTIVSSGLNGPEGVAFDLDGNLFIGDTFNNNLDAFNVSSNALFPLITGDAGGPSGLAVDLIGNIFFNDSQTINKWSVTDGSQTIVVSNGLHFPSGVSVDGSGNVYIADRFNDAIKMWSPLTGQTTTLVSNNLNKPFAVVPDAARNLYFVDSFNNLLKELPRVFVDPRSKSEPASAGTDLLPVVLPATENLNPPFQPTSDQPWLTITGVSNGIVSFAFTQNPGAPRSANITLFGQPIQINQFGNIAVFLSATLVSNNTQFRLTFSNSPSGSFTVLSSSNLSLPVLNWTVLGSVTDGGSGQYSFSLPLSTNVPTLFFRVRSP